MADEDDEKQPVYDDEDQESPLFKWLSAMVVLLAIAGFFGLAWYAYKNGGETVDEKDVELVHADKTPVKEAPANPGGMQIPNQDKTVYGLISGKTEKPVVERILPAPEEPLPRTGNGNTETWMSDSVKNKSGGEVETKVASAAPASDSDTDTPAPKEQFNPAKVRSAAQSAPVTPPASVQPAAVPVAPISPVATVDKVASTMPVQAKAVTPPPGGAVHPAPAPVPVQKPPAKVVAEDTDDTEDAKPAAKPEPKPSAQPAPAGVRVQLGAYKSQGEADGRWAKISQQFSDDLKGKQHYVMRADLGKKGVYYRLQVMPFASGKEADEFCLDFVSAGQPCFPTKGK
jgi:cell division septation protein DedD